MIAGLDSSVADNGLLGGGLLNRGRCVFWGALHRCGCDARVRANNTIERLNREIRRITYVVGTFSDGKSELTLVTARLKYLVENECVQSH